ncbi:cytochrome P450 [Corynebacterium incognita]|nr:cytochrome P450 [Corynebacterium incognita]
MVVAGHAEAVAVAQDPMRYSSAVSRFMQLPNGLDGEAHTAMRGLLDRYLNVSVVEKLEATFRGVARELLKSFPGSSTVDAVSELGEVYAVRAMLAWLGWPQELEPRLLAWVQENSAATRSGELERTAAVAAEFDAIIGDVITPRVDNPGEDVTSALVHDTSLGRRLEGEEVVSILRNWTAGDLGSMARCIGVIVARLCDDTTLQDRLRQGVKEVEFTSIADEILRIDDPFVSNRRITTCPVKLGDLELPAGQRVRIHWTAANRDPRAFPEPDTFAPEANAERNLVWGTGPHECPGKPLSMVELRAFFEELLTQFKLERPEQGTAAAPQREEFPVGGWARLPVVLTRL